VIRDEQRAVLDRLMTRIGPMDHEDKATYLLLCMAVICGNAPDVAVFVLDRVDARLDVTAKRLEKETT